MNMRLVDADFLMEDLFIKFGNQIPDGLFREINKATIYDLTNDEKWMAGHRAGYEQAIIDGKLTYQECSVRGEWLQYRKGHYTGVKCSLCDTIMDFTTNYCPKCGAKMEGV